MKRLLLSMVMTLAVFWASNSEILAVESFSLVVMPDSQGYPAISVGTSILNAQMSWVLNNTEKLNIKYVLHEGDMTGTNSEKQWTIFRNAISKLDGKMPYALAPGNHDYGLTNRDSTMFNKYFKKDGWAGTNLGGVMEVGKLDNAYYFFDVDGVKWMIIVLEFGPRKSALDWANKIVSANQDKRVILLTHGYMTCDGSITDKEDTSDPHWTQPGKTTPFYYGQFGSDMASGVDIWEELVRKQKNIVLVLNGHYTCTWSIYKGAANRTDINNGGEKVSAQFANYQNLPPTYGEGYMRLLTFYPDEGRVLVSTLSPYLHKTMTDPTNNFNVRGLNLGGAKPTPTGIMILGDANGDKTVNLNDFTVWKKEYMNQLTTKTADFNKNGTVNIDDFMIWKKEYTGVGIQ